jgi:hypothetical protein
MTRHPIISAFVAALLIAVVLAVVLPFSAQEAPWALLLIAVAFPFIWFLAWLIFNGFAWWKSTMTIEERPVGESRRDGDAGSA